MPPRHLQEPLPDSKKEFVSPRAYVSAIDRLSPQRGRVTPEEIAWAYKEIFNAEQVIISRFQGRNSPFRYLTQVDTLAAAADKEVGPAQFTHTQYEPTILQTVQRFALPVVTDTPTEDYPNDEVIQRLKPGAIASFPIVAGKEVVGAITLLTKGPFNTPIQFEGMSCGRQEFFEHLTSIIGAVTLDRFTNKSDMRTLTPLVINQLLDNLERWHKGTRQHSEELAEMTREIGLRLGLSQSELDDLYWGTLLHDIGKMIIPFSILVHPSKLSTEQKMAMDIHPKIGEHICQLFPGLLPYASMIFFHHVNYDGTGYPISVKNHLVPIEAQIIHSCDIAHAMLEKRPYRNPPSFPLYIVIEKILAGRETQHNPKIADALIQYLSERPAGSIIEKLTE